MLEENLNQFEREKEHYESIKPEEIQEQNIEKVDLTQLNKDLEERGLTSTKNSLDSQKTSKKNLVRMLRENKERGQSLMTPSAISSEQPSYLSLQSQIGDITFRNNKIEKLVKMEILGMRGITGPVQYAFWDFYHSKIKGEPIEKAEEIITEQSRAVERVIGDLDIVAKSIEYKDRKLDYYYNLGVGKIIEKAKDRGKILAEINDRKRIMEDIERAFREHSLDSLQRLNYEAAHRNARIEFERKFYDLDLGNNAIEWIRNEQPLLDTLGQICRAYSHALKKTGQEARLMLTHLENVVSPYVDMLRHQKIQPRMDGAIKKLFTLAYNMDKALKNNTGEIVEKANRSSLFAEGFKSRALTQEDIYRDIESSNSVAFTQVENRIAGYLGEK